MKDYEGRMPGKQNIESTPSTNEPVIEEYESVNTEIESTLNSLVAR